MFQSPRGLRPGLAGRPDIAPAPEAAPGLSRRVALLTAAIMAIAALAGRAAAPAGPAGWLLLAGMLAGSLVSALAHGRRSIVAAGVTAVLLALAAALVWPADSGLEMIVVSSGWAIAAFAVARLAGALRAAAGSAHRIAGDPLAGLPGATAFARALSIEVDRGARYQRPLSVVVCRAGGIGEIRRVYGHETADGLMRIIAGLALDNVRAADLVGRLDEEEIGIILPETTPDGAARLTDRLLGSVDLLRVPATRHLPAMSPDVHVGVAGLESEADTAAGILERARRSATGADAPPRAAGAQQDLGLPETRP